MRYPEHIPPEQLARHASDDMLLFTAVLSILISVVLIYLGRRGKQQWLVLWSAGLIVCSMAMGGWILLDGV